MTKNVLVTSVLLSFSVFACTVLADSSVWKVSKGGNYFYLGGTIHILTESDHPLPKEFSIAYKDASKIFFEADISAAQTPKFQSEMLTAMTFSDDRTLASELDPETYGMLEDFMRARNLPIENFSRFKPWGVSLMITTLEYQRLGMMADYGVDMYFNDLAIADGKVIASLETTAEQLRFLSSMEEIDPNLGIQYTLLDLDRLPEFITLMRKSWRNGNLEILSKSPFMLQMKIEFPEMYSTLVTDRNYSWMEQLPSLTDDSAIELVLVGAMHLSDKEGLLSQLRSQGFLVEQL